MRGHYLVVCCLGAKCLMKCREDIFCFCVCVLPVPPQVTQCQSNQQIISTDQPITLSCTVRGDGEVKVVFSRDNQPLPDSSTDTVSVGAGSKMATHSISSPTAGQYSCHAIVNGVRDTSNCSWVLWTSAASPTTGQTSGQSEGESSQCLHIPVHRLLVLL